MRRGAVHPVLDANVVERQQFRHTFRAGHDGLDVGPDSPVAFEVMHDLDLRVQATRSTVAVCSLSIRKGSGVA